MKKISILSVVTILMIGAAFALPEIYEESIPKAEISVLSNIVYTPSVNASGIVEKSEIICLVYAAVSEDDISKVKPGQAAVISGKGFGEREYEGVVEYISDTAVTQQYSSESKTVIEVSITITNPDEMIRKGNSADVKIITAKEREVLLVPYEAVNQDDDGTEYVYIFSEGVAVRRDIITGLELSSGIEVLSGITPDDTVLKSNESIAEGNYIKVIDNG